MRTAALPEEGGGPNAEVGPDQRMITRTLSVWPFSTAVTM